MVVNSGGETACMIEGPTGPIEVVSMAPRAGAPTGQAIICHPHSQMGGTLQNKVVHTIARVHRDAGHLAVRFNFRGVGRSGGEFDAGRGEGDDLAAVLCWARQQCPQGKLYLAGFSFGSFVLARSLAAITAEGIPVAQALLVAPPVHHFEFQSLTGFPCPVTVIMGEEDEVVPPADVYRWFDTVTTPCRLVRVPAAGHFFHGLLGELKALVENDIG